MYRNPNRKRSLAESGIYDPHAAKQKVRRADNLNGRTYTWEELSKLQQAASIVHEEFPDLAERLRELSNTILKPPELQPSLPWLQVSVPSLEAAPSWGNHPTNGRISAEYGTLLSEDLQTQDPRWLMDYNSNHVNPYDNITRPAVTASDSGHNLDTLSWTATLQDLNALESAPFLELTPYFGATDSMLQDQMHYNPRHQDIPISDGLASFSEPALSPARSCGGTSHYSATTSGTSPQAKCKRTRQKPGRKEEIAEVRKCRACIRCHSQKLTCDTNVEGDCSTCMNIKGPVLFKPPCLRYRISDAKVFAKADHPRFIWTRRWKNMTIVDIAKWRSQEIKTIRVTQDVADTSYQLQVREFVPEPEDALERTWKTNKIKRSYKCTPFAIANMEESSAELKSFVERTVGESISHYTNKTDQTDKLLRDSYDMAYTYSQNPSQEGCLLRDVLQLWCAIRMESRSEYVCLTGDTLGMAPQDHDRECKNYGRILLPPVMGAQIQLIMTVKILQPLAQKVLRQLQKLIEKKRPSSWFAIYLCLFVLLHSCALFTSSAKDRAKKHGLDKRYIDSEFVEELHLGADIMLVHFHCIKGGHPFKKDFWKSKENPVLAELDKDQLAFLDATSEQIENLDSHFKNTRANDVYEDDYFFLSQLYDWDWKRVPTKVDD